MKKKGYSKKCNTKFMAVENPKKRKKKKRKKKKKEKKRKEERGRQIIQGRNYIDRWTGHGPTILKGLALQE